MASRASDSPSSYEQKLLDILAEREKSADQDKWLGLAEMGMRLMASSNPNLLSAIGESGLGAFGSYRKQQAGQDAEELNILGKLADMDMAEAERYKLVKILPLPLQVLEQINPL